MDRQARYWELAEALLATAQAPAEWEGALTRLSDHFSCNGSQCLVFSRNGGQLDFGAVGRIDPAAQQEFEAHYFALDFRRPRYLTHAAHVAFTDFDITTPHERRRSPFHREFLAKYDCAQLLMANFPLARDRVGLLVLGRSHSGPDFDARTRREAEQMLIPLRSALRLAEERRLLQQHSATLEAHLDSLNAGIFLLGRRGQLLHANAAARRMLREASTFCLRRGTLTMCDADANARFAALLERAGARQSRGACSEYSLSLHDEDPRTRVQISVRHFGHTGWSDEGPTAALAVTVVDGASRLDRIAALRSHFGMTQAEARCASLLCDGVSVTGVAKLAGVARPTVRAHVQSLFRKTETHRQGELVAVLNRFLNALARAAPAQDD